MFPVTRNKMPAAVQKPKAVHVLVLNGVCLTINRGKSCTRFKMHLISEMAGDEDSGDRDRTFIFSEEGHTFGNALRSIIARYPEVQFCGYTVPHPSESKIHFRIQTYGPRAVDILRTGMTDLEKLCDHTILVFEDRMEDFKSRTS